MSLNPQELQNMLDELEASRASCKRAWEPAEENRWVLKDTAGMELPPPVRKTIDLEGRMVKDGVRKRSKIGKSFSPIWSTLYGNIGGLPRLRR